MNTPQIETASMLQARFAPGALGETNSRRGFPIDFSAPLESTVCNLAEVRTATSSKLVQAKTYPLRPITQRGDG
jgi:hypothetical protein